MADINQIPVTVVRPGDGEYVALPGYGAVFKLCSKANGGEVLHELPEFGELADKYGLTYGTPAWMDGIRQRYGLNAPSH